MVARQVNVLLVTIALQGHMNPMLMLAKRLVSKGINVIIATNNVASDRILKSSKDSTNFPTAQNTNPKPPGISLVFFSDGLSQEFDRDENVDSFIKALRTTGAKNLSILINVFTAQDKKFSCIIFNPFMPWVTDIAAELGIPCGVLWIQACTVYLVYYHYFKHPNLFPSIESPDEFLELPGVPVLKVTDLPSLIFPSSPSIFRETLLDFIQKLDKIKWVLVNSFAELEEEAVKSMACLHPIYPIGPLVSPFLLGEEESTSGSIDMWSAENSCIEWLDEKPPSSVIYISFGSISVLSQKQMDNLAMGLKNSNRPFLWVIKPPEKDFEKKGGELPATFLEETKGRGLLVRWCPQDKVLMHQSVACFITHCGWNSTLETVVAGVPVIAYPGWTDQPTVAKFLVDVLKNGVRMKVEDEVASSGEVERSIVEVTIGPKSEEMKKRALELKEASRKVVADGGSSNQNINQFITEIIGGSFLQSITEVEGKEIYENA
ncbi:hypothetical protein P3X46_012543 [Hevea brasiliensis]|uniref:Glycosyltransferase n=1 Tax=Hevea brasiliensis TaxID=3981 RepID=A0ABQ9MEG4_HEVBR|nr:UDP-glycosyltransferase 84B2-like [Hevea brasiliensis]KAJ9177309.1 hypothetical protein P3X46_012543 [Hevea brasiliensis]